MEQEIDITAYINSLQIGETKQRKKSLECIQEALFKREIPLPEPELKKLFETLRLHLLKSFSDQAESCRELCIDIVEGFIKYLPVNNYYLTYIIPLIVQRIGKNERIEQSEELRLKLVQLLSFIIERYANKNQLNPFYDEFINILLKTLMDNYSRVNQESCAIILKLVEYLQRDFHKRADELIEPLIKNLGHQHSKLRCIAVEAIGNVCLFASKLDDCWGALGGKLLDSSPLVRLKVGQVSAKMLLVHVDRYSYWPRILPLLLICLTDESDLVSFECLDLWKQVGAKYEAENVEDLKDRMDYLAHILPDRYPEGYVRPPLGCRVLIERNITRMVPPIARELGAWKPEMRLGAARLLTQVVLHAERGGTQAMPMTLDAIIKGCLTDEPDVVRELERTCEIIGCLIPYKTWGPLIEPQIESNCTASHLKILAHILRGANADILDRQNIAMIIANKDVCQMRKIQYLRELLKVCENLLPIGEQDPSEYDADMMYMERNIYVVIMTIIALSGGTDDLKGQALVVLSKLASNYKVLELHSRHVEYLLKTLLVKTTGKFSGNSVDYLLMDAILENCSEILNVHWEMVCVILEGIMAMESELKIRTFTSLALVFLDWKSYVGEMQVLEKLIDDIIAPSLVWAPGQIADSCRTAAASCLCALMQNSTKATLLLPKHVPLLITLLEDSSARTRLFVVKVIALLPDELDFKQLGKVYLALGKRLDDSDHTIRVCSAQALGAVAMIGARLTANSKTLTDEDDSYFVGRPILMDIYKTALLHLDDRDPEVRNVMFEALKCLGQNGPRLLMDLIQSTKSKFCNKKECEELQIIMKTFIDA